MLDMLVHQLQSHQFLTLFLALGLGFLIGKVKMGKFQLGGVAGTLLVAVLLGQIGGMSISPQVQGIFFALFIFMVGYNGGPQFFSSFNRSSIGLLFATISMTVLGLISVVILAQLAGLDMGLAAGLAAGALTQSAIIGTAGNAIDTLGLAPEMASQFKTNVAVGYSVTYIFGSLGPILVIAILPIIYGWDIREEAKKLAAKLGGGSVELDEGEFFSLNSTRSRAYILDESSTCLDKTIDSLEEKVAGHLVVDEIIRNDEIMTYDGNTVLQLNDIVIVSGLVSSFSEHAVQIGTETSDVALSQNLVQVQRDVVVTNPEFDNMSLEDVSANLTREERHGAFVTNIKRMGHNLGVLPKTIIHRGDEVSIMGKQKDVSRLSKIIGYNSPLPSVTDFTVLGIGMALGYLIGEISFDLGGTSISLGSGLGCLVSGLFVGYLRMRVPKAGGINQGAANFLQTFGLALFVGVVGLNAAEPALKAIQEYGLTLLFLGFAATLIPMILQFPINYYLLKIKNPVTTLSLIAGSRSANPAFATLLDKTQNATPVATFTITYALANIMLTLWGPVIIAIFRKSVS